MAYEVFIDDLELPITPSKIETKIKGNNKDINLLNEGDINVLKYPGLSEISFTAILPQTKYPFALNDTKPIVFLNKFEKLKTEKKPFQFIVVRTTPKNEILFYTDLKVSLEDYTITEDAKNGFDLSVAIKLKQYKEYGTKVVKIIEKQGRIIASTTNKRNTASAPKPKTHTVASGESLWNIAKKYFGDGSRYREIYELNKDIIKNPNVIYVGQVLKLPS